MLPFNDQLTTSDCSGVCSPCLIFLPCPSFLVRWPCNDLWSLYGQPQHHKQIIHMLLYLLTSMSFRFVGPWLRLRRQKDDKKTTERGQSGQRTSSCLPWNLFAILCVPGSMRIRPIAQFPWTRRQCGWFSVFLAYFEGEAQPSLD